MKYTAYHERNFRQYVQKAMNSAQKVLDINRNPKVAEDEDHSYDDKFAFAEFLTNTSIAAQMNLLQQLGMTQEKVEKLNSIVHEDKRSVTIRFEAEDSCQFTKETKVKVVQQDSEYINETTQEKTGFLGGISSKRLTNEHKVIKKVKEYHWRVTLKYRLFCYAGNDPEKDPLELCSRVASTLITTTGSKTPPRGEKNIHSFMEESLTWLFQNMKHSKKQWTTDFRIDRNNQSCRTPRRNDHVESAIQFFNGFSNFSSKVKDFFSGTVENEILGRHNPANSKPIKRMSLADMDCSSIFCPVLPLLENECDLPGTVTRGENPRSLLVLPADNAESSKSPILSIGDIDLFLNEQCRTIHDVLQSLKSTFPSPEENIISSLEAKIFLLVIESSKLAGNYIQCVEYIEYMLETQLIAAIGKVVKPEDFDQFMRFHTRKLFAEYYRPKPFCYSIRRSDEHYPEGLLSIETTKSMDGIDPCFTHVRHISGANALPIRIPLNAATEVEITGNRYLHGWMNHMFESNDLPSYQLTARAHQFSSFILMVGTMAGPDNFTPKDAIIIQNKDEILIPLLLDELPSAKEFKDAITSLSPEQQRFAKSFRGMQLESSVFGVCVIQLKPQLETLLGLSDDSLTKEIKLTQDLMSLFIDYQIPSNLLSFDGDRQDKTIKTRVDRIKENVKAVMDVIDSTKKDELGEEKLRAQSRFYQDVCNLENEGISAYERENYDRDKGNLENIVLLRENYDGDECCEEPARSMLSAVPVSSSEKSSKKTSRKGKFTKRLKSIKTSFSKAVEMENYDLAKCSEEPTRSMFNSVEAPRSMLNSVEADTVDAKIETQNNEVDRLGNRENILPKREEGEGIIDFTMIPKHLDRMFDTHDEDGSVRSTILKTADSWTRKRQANLLSTSKESFFLDESGPTRKDERNKAFDLLDALSRSGSLPISCAELHVVVAVTHRFENDVMGTVVQDSINPIEKVEKTLLMLACAIHGIDESSSAVVANLFSTPDHRERLIGSFPELFQNERQIV